MQAGLGAGAGIGVGGGVCVRIGCTDQVCTGRTHRVPYLILVLQVVGLFFEVARLREGA